MCGGQATVCEGVCGGVSGGMGKETALSLETHGCCEEARSLGTRTRGESLDCTHLLLYPFDIHEMHAPGWPYGMPEQYGICLSVRTPPAFFQCWYARKGQPPNTPQSPYSTPSVARTPSSLSHWGACVAEGSARWCQHNPINQHKLTRTTMGSMSISATYGVEVAC